MSLINNRIGLSISEDRMQLVETVRSGDVQCTANVDEEFFDEAISVDTKEAKYIHLLQNAFNEILLRNSISGTILCVTLPPVNFKVFEIPADKNLTKNDLKEYIKWEISKLFPTKSKDYFIFQKIVLNPLHFESTRRVLVFALPAHILRSIHKFSMRNNLQLKYVDHAHTAVYGLLKNEDQNFPLLSLFIDGNLISFFIFSNENIVNQFSTEYESINEVPDISKRIIEKFEEKDNIGKLYLFGNNITSELHKTLENELDIPAKILNPFAGVEICEDLKSNKFINESSVKFSPALGVVLRK